MFAEFDDGNIKQDTFHFFMEELYKMKVFRLKCYKVLMEFCLCISTKMILDVCLLSCLNTKTLDHSANAIASWSLWSFRALMLPCVIDRCRIIFKQCLKHSTFKVVSLNYLEIMENSLKSETDALGTVVRFCRHLVHRLAQRVREVQHLQTKQE